MHPILSYCDIFVFFLDDLLSTREMVKKTPNGQVRVERCDAQPLR